MKENTSFDEKATKLTIYNYKGYFSIVLMAIVNVDYHFTYLDVGNYRSNGDSGIFKIHLLE